MGDLPEHEMVERPPSLSSYCESQCSWYCNDVGERWWWKIVN